MPDTTLQPLHINRIPRPAARALSALALTFITLPSVNSMAATPPGVNTSPSGIPSIVFADKDLEAAKREITSLQGQIKALSAHATTGACTSIEEKLASLKKENTYLTNALEKDITQAAKELADLKKENTRTNTSLATLKNVGKELAATKAALEKANREVLVLKEDNEHLKKVVAVKNSALDSAMKALTRTVVTKGTPHQVAGDEYIEETLGRITMTKKGDKLVVTVKKEVETAADARFLGGVIEKNKLANGDVVFTLDAAKFN